MTATLEDLEAVGRKVADEIADAIRIPRLEAIRQALQEVGIRRAREAVKAAPLRIAEAATALTNAIETERQARKRVDDEILAHEWDLDGRFVHEGNKWFLVDGDERRQMTADERARWKAAEAARSGGVMAATEALHAAEHATAEARNALNVAEKHFSACKYDLTAAVAELGALGIGIATTPDPREDHAR